MISLKYLRFSILLVAYIFRMKYVQGAREELVDKLQVGDSNSSLEVVEQTIRQNNGFFRCLTNNPCTLVCRGTAYTDFQCDVSNGVCVCLKGLITKSQCSKADPGSVCSKSYVKCIYSPFTTDSAEHYLCNTDPSNNAAAVSQLCVHERKYFYQRCTGNQICEDVCRFADVTGMCVPKGICICGAGLKSKVGCRQLFSEVEGACYDYGGRYSNKYICDRAASCNGGTLKPATSLCVHELFPPETCRPLNEICEKKEDCCTSCCDKNMCQPKTFC